MAGRITFSKTARRGLLCVALILALLGQNFRHVKAAAIVPGAAATITMLDESTVIGDDNNDQGDVTATWPKSDCCKHCAQPVALLYATSDFAPMRPAHAAEVPACGVGAPPPHPDEPPRA